MSDAEDYNEYDKEDVSKLIKHDIDIVSSDEGLIFNPYNPQNIDISVRDVENILSKYGIPSKIHNINLYKRAFVHKSYMKRPYLLNEQENITITEQPDNCLSLKTKSNERLEFLGDGVLECITKYYLYRRFPKENEGFMTENKIKLVKNEAIGALAQEMGLHKWLLISRHAEEKGTRMSHKKLGCLFEAFLGALFLDFNKIEIHDDDKWFDNVFVTGPGFQMAQIFIENIFEKHVDWDTIIRSQDNFKNLFQVIIQKEFKTTPDYIEINNDSDDGYTMGVYLCLGAQIYEMNPANAIPYENFNSLQDIQNLYEQIGNVFIIFGTGTHKVKKKAEQLACLKAYKLCSKSPV